MRTRRSINCLLAISLLVSACSESPPPEAPAVTEQAEEAPTVGPEEDLASLGSLDDLLPDDFLRLADAWTGDLDGMAEREVVRTLVVGGGPQFFYFNGKPRGIVAELLVGLQDQLNEDLDRRYRQLEVVPMPVSRDRLIPALVSGRADLVAADITITEGRSDLADFSIPFVTEIDEIVVFAPGFGDNIQSLEDLSGRNIFVRRSSSYYEHLQELNEQFDQQGIEPIRIDAANELLRSQDILDMVNSGMVSATVIDSYKAGYWSEIFPNMQARDDLVVNEGGELAWVIRKDSPLLKAAIDKFARNNRQGTLLGNVLIDRYMENLHWVRNATADSEYQKLEPMLELFRKSGEATGFDPLMLVAQAYQESRLDQEKVSPVGALGIMQVKPSTAADRNVGIDDISTVENNILAGATYMRFMSDRYFSDEGMDELQAWFFSLAAYNAGPARIRDLREQAAAEGHDPNIWIDNVELIAARVIGRETVRYVRNIFKYDVAYRMAFAQRELREEINYLR